MGMSHAYILRISWPSIPRKERRGWYRQMSPWDGTSEPRSLLAGLSLQIPLSFRVSSALKQMSLVLLSYVNLTRNGSGRDVLDPPTAISNTQSVSSDVDWPPACPQSLEDLTVMNNPHQGISVFNLHHGIDFAKWITIISEWLYCLDAFNGQTAG